MFFEFGSAETLGGHFKNAGCLDCGTIGAHRKHLNNDKIPSHSEEILDRIGDFAS